MTTNPGQITDDDFDAKVAVPILGSSNAPESALLRRLLFESYSLTATELKRKEDNTESDAPKKLPIQEIAARLTAIEKKLQPLKIESVLEPSHALVNALAQCAEDGRLRYIEWSRCTSRQKPKTNAAADKPQPAGNPQPKPKNKPWSPPKGGKFDKKNRRLSKTPMPAQLRGGTPVDSDGKSICYGYNLDHATTSSVNVADMCVAVQVVSPLHTISSTMTKQIDSASSMAC